MNQASKFCGECGSPLEQETHFCGECGTPTADRQENSHNVSTDSSEPEPEKVTKKVSAKNNLPEPKIETNDSLETIENKNTFALWAQSRPAWVWIALTLLLVFVLFTGGLPGFLKVSFLVVGDGLEMKVIL